ncbi:MAG: hypothetical protein LBE32_05830 [Burkholderiales bacterium]|jgi:hypothetical protein|nr:hypothetical protein [Burkholderiales bacterium]
MPAHAMGKAGLRLATKNDEPLVLAFDYAHDKDEYAELKREEKITKAISHKNVLLFWLAVR